MATSGVFTIPLIPTEGSGGLLSENSRATVVSRHFIAGPENRVLCILTDLVGTSSPQFNPLTISGPVGVGKSHLLHGLVERQRTSAAATSCTVTTGADFARGFGRAIEVDSVAEWRDKLYGTDLFVLDDVHELEGKPPAQWELTQAIDELVQRNHQVILSIRQAVPDWTWMLPGLRSRMAGGLVLPVALPGLEAQRRMLQVLAATLGLVDDLDTLLPEPTESPTYPQLRSAVLRRLQQRSEGEWARSESDEPPPADSPAERPRERLSQIARLVARQSHVRLADLRGPSRRHSTVLARSTAIYLSRLLLRLSFDDLGEYFGGRDHTTVLYSWRKACERLETEPSFKHEVGKLVAALQAGDGRRSGRTSRRSSGSTISKFVGR